jgi:hypothetical protein
MPPFHHPHEADMTNKGTFVPTDTHSRLVEKIADLLLKPCPFDAAPARRAWLENEIKIVLGEIGDIWPLEIYGDVFVAAIEDAEKRRALACSR